MKRVDQWTYFIKNAENLEVISETVQDEGLKEAYQEANRNSWTQSELDDYERASIKEQDEIGRIDLTIKKLVKSFKDNRVSIDVIIKSTGLTKEEINNL